MGLIRALIVLAVLLPLPACATTDFPYKWYGLGLKPDQYESGKLLGPTEEDDLDFSVCKPDPARPMTTLMVHDTDGNSYMIQTQGKCVVMLTEEFERLSTDFVQAKSDLRHCEKPK